MITVENYDGLCGIIPTFASSDLQIRCNYEIGHGGPCSFEKYKRHFYFSCGCGRYEYENWLINREDDDGIKRGFIDSVVYHLDEDKYCLVSTAVVASHSH